MGARRGGPYQDIRPSGMTTLNGPASAPTGPAMNASMSASEVSAYATPVCAVAESKRSK